jgi:hypothetical protein
MAVLARRSVYPVIVHSIATILLLAGWSSQAHGAAPPEAATPDWQSDARQLAGTLSNAARSMGFPSLFYLDAWPRRGIALSDANGDGHVDLVTWDSDQAWLLPGNSAGRFGGAGRWPADLIRQVTVVADFDADGADDTAVERSPGPGVLVRLAGKGAELPEDLVAWNPVAGPALAQDFNGDGTPDLAVIRAPAREVVIYLIEAAGEVVSARGISTEGRPVSLCAEDFTGDGEADLAVAAGRGVTLFTGDGAGDFGPATRLNTDFRPAAIAAGDVNGDTLADLALVDAAGTRAAVLPGDGRGGFGQPIGFDLARQCAGERSAAAEASGAGAAVYSGPPVTGLALSPATIAGGSGATVTGTVTVASPAPAGGTLIALGSSNTDLAASIPSVTVAEGATTATFSIGTNPLYRRYSGLGFAVTITATNPGDASTRSAVLTVTAQARPPDVTGPDSDMTGLHCSGQPPDNSILVDCRQGPNPSTPGPCRFKEECMLGCQDLQDQGTNLRATCATTPPFPVTINPRYVVGGGAVAGTVQLPSAAPAGSESMLSTNSVFVAFTPQIFVPFPIGATSANFSIATSPVALPGFAAIRARNVVPQPASGGGTFFAARSALTWLAIVPPGGSASPALASLTLDPATVQECDTATGTITLTSAPTGSVQVFLSSSNSQVVEVPIDLPFSVIVPQGATSAPFTIRPRQVTATTVVNITATLAGVSRSAPLTVTRTPGPGLLSLVLNPGTVAGGQNSTGTVNLLSAAPTGGTEVRISTDTNIAAAPPGVTVLAGQTSASFTITTLPRTVGTVTGIVAIRGCVSSPASLVVTATPAPGSLSAVAVSPSIVTGGADATGTVTLTSAAPAGGALVALSSNQPAVAAVPASGTVLVPEGTSSAPFTVTTSPVAAQAQVTITASYLGVVRTAGLTVNPPPPPAGLSSLGLNPASLTGGSSSTGTVTLSGPAPAGGATVALSSNTPAVAAVPASGTVLVPEGATSATFPVTTSPVAAQALVTLSATYLGVTRSATLTVNPVPTGPLPAPSLLGPAHDARFAAGQTITFDWSDVAGAASYTLQIDDAESFSAPLVAGPTLTVSQFSSSTLPVRRMWWRVRANSDSGSPGAWSAVRRFEIR